MKIIEVNPRGLCHGVATAMNIVSTTVSKCQGEPIYIVGHIVHNQNVSEAFRQLGAITIEGNSREEIIDKINSGTIIITAHGISPNVLKKAENKGLNIVNATCTDVSKTHNIINDRLDNGFNVIYIGKDQHPETEAALGIDKERIVLVEKPEDINTLNLTHEKLCLTNQTTFSMWDLKDIIFEAKKKYPNIEIIDEVCNATRERQEAIYRVAKEADLMVVVGDVKSNNTNKLVEICELKAGTPAIRVNNVSEIDIDFISKFDSIGVSSGASTPSLITKQVITFLKQFDKNDSSTFVKPEVVELRRIVPRIKK